MQVRYEMVSYAHVRQLTVSLARNCFVKRLSCLNLLHFNAKVFEQPEFYISFFSGLWSSSSGFSFEARGRTFRPVVFHSMSGTLISILEVFFEIL